MSHPFAYRVVNEPLGPFFSHDDNDAVCVNTNLLGFGILDGICEVVESVSHLTGSDICGLRVESLWWRNHCVSWEFEGLFGISWIKRDGKDKGGEVLYETGSCLEIGGMWEKQTRKLTNADWLLTCLRGTARPPLPFPPPRRTGSIDFDIGNSCNEVVEKGESDLIGLM